MNINYLTLTFTAWILISAPSPPHSATLRHTPPHSTILHHTPPQKSGPIGPYITTPTFFTNVQCHIIKHLCWPQPFGRYGKISNHGFAVLTSLSLGQHSKSSVGHFQVLPSLLVSKLFYITSLPYWLAKYSLTCSIIICVSLIATIELSLNDFCILAYFVFCVKKSKQLRVALSDYIF